MVNKESRDWQSQCYVLHWTRVQGTRVSSLKSDSTVIDNVFSLPSRLPSWAANDRGCLCSREDTWRTSCSCGLRRYCRNNRYWAPVASFVMLTLCPDFTRNRPFWTCPELGFHESVGNDRQSRLDEEFSARKRRNRTIGDSSTLCHKSPATDTFPLGYRPLPLAFTYVCRLSPPTWPGKLYRKTVVRRFLPPIAHTRARSLWRHHHLDCWFAR